MYAIKRKIFPVAILTILAFTLLNSNAFGGNTLIALFLFCISTGLLAVFYFGHKIFYSTNTKLKIPSYIAVFLLLTLYILLHGIFYNRVSLTHYYWIACSIFLFTVNTWANDFYQKQDNIFSTKSILFIHKGVTALAFLETIVVFLQCTFILPSPNKNFLCTGTWINPNVTAMFLSLSLFSTILVLRNINQKATKRIFQVILFATILAIALLKCRTAYIVAATLLLTEYWFTLIKTIKSYLKLNLKGLFVVLVALVIFQALFSVFSNKKQSTLGRINIWQNAATLIKEQPLFGYGFGQFEKVYNQSIAQEPHINNDHVNMAYNDFVELGVEGGLIAVFFWLLFLFILIKQITKQPKSSVSLLPIVLSFIIIQLTNFGIQAIPVMVLFLLYVSYFNPTFSTSKESSSLNQSVAQNNWLTPLRKVCVVAVFIISSIYTITVFNLMASFYKNWMQNNKSPNAILFYNYRSLNQSLHGYPIYHEKYGDALLNANQTSEALKQYKFALQNTSSPDIITKTGFCFQQLKIYDSSKHYYTITENMQPNKISPKFMLLKLYLQKGDSTMIKAKATEIKNMNVKIRNRKAQEIKKYADSVLTILH